MHLLIDCPNCYTTLQLPPGVRSIHCAVCNAITPVAYPKFSQYPPPHNYGTYYYHTYYYHSYQHSPIPMLSFHIHAPPIPLLDGPDQALIPAMSNMYTPTELNQTRSMSHLTSSSGKIYQSPYQSHSQQYAIPAPSPYNHAPPGVPPLAYGSKRAVICGVLYNNCPQLRLQGCFNDATLMKKLLVNTFNFPESCIIMLTDANPMSTPPEQLPTAKNIMNALRWLVHGCQPGDSLVFHFSGHGYHIKDEDGDESDGEDEFLCPSDFNRTRETMILDDDINATIVKPLPYGAKLHAIIDACHSGTVLDLPCNYKKGSDGHCAWQLTSIKGKGTSGGKAVCFSGCDDKGTVAENSLQLNTADRYGAMTLSFYQAIQNKHTDSYWNMLKSMRADIQNISTERRRGLLNRGGTGLATENIQLGTLPGAHNVYDLIERGEI